MMTILTIILGILWILYASVLLYYRRVVPINIYGILLLTSVLQGLFLFYDLNNNEFIIQTDVEPIILRGLVLICFSMTLWNKIKLNKYLTTLSRSNKNLLINKDLPKTKIFYKHNDTNN